MKTSDFDYPLPSQLIAQTPVESRDHARLLILRRNDGSLEHRHFYDIGDYLQSGDVLVCNDSRVIPARLLGRKVDGGARVELLLLRRLEHGSWEALARPGRRLREGTRIEIGTNPALQAQVLEKAEGGIVTVSFSDGEAVEKAGTVPLPPYIRLPLADAERYQTVYAREKGSAAAPTAGLHFTPELMERLQKRGIRFAFVTLHLGLDSFRPLQADDPRRHVLHREYCELSPEAATELSQAKLQGRRVICVGTSTVRTVEQAARANQAGARSFSGWADLFILPGHRFRMVDALITNFHLPRTTLLMLVSAFAGRELVLRAYSEAMRLGYRFYSFGDCMIVL